MIPIFRYKNRGLAGVVVLMLLLCVTSCSKEGRRERRSIREGNELYLNREFAEASKKYQEALDVNPNSALGKYNLGISQLKQVTNLQDTTPQNKSLLAQAAGNLQSVGMLLNLKPGLASKSFYNLGNLSFNTQDYQKAVDAYKVALRLNPDDDIARKNLRIAQKNLKNQDKDNNQNNQNNQDQQDQQEQDQQNQDQQQNPQNDQQQNENQQKEQNNINQQAADRILQAVDNKENQTRARVNRASKGDKSQGDGVRRKRW